MGKQTIGYTTKSFMDGCINIKIKFNYIHSIEDNTYKLFPHIDYEMEGIFMKNEKLKEFSKLIYEAAQLGLDREDNNSINSSLE